MLLCILVTQVRACVNELCHNCFSQWISTPSTPSNAWSRAKEYISIDFCLKWKHFHWRGCTNVGHIAETPICSVISVHVFFPNLAWYYYTPCCLRWPMGHKLASMDSHNGRHSDWVVIVTSLSSQAAMRAVTFSCAACDGKNVTMATFVVHCPTSQTFLVWIYSEDFSWILRILFPW